MLIEPGLSLNEFTLWTLPMLDPHPQPVSSPFGFVGSARASLVSGQRPDIIYSMRILRPTEVVASV